MKLSNLMTLNAILYIALGIAFALYAPLMIAMFGILELEGSTSMYWYAASFARMFGAALFGFGFLIFAVRRFSEHIGAVPQEASTETRRGVVFALLLANILAFIVAITQQTSIWGTLVGWVTIGIFILLLFGYGYFLVTK